MKPNKKTRSNLPTANLGDSSTAPVNSDRNGGKNGNTDITS